MKTMLLEIEDTLYDRLMAFIEQLPIGQVRVLDEKEASGQSTLSVEEAADHVLAKNAELYKRLS
uniref:Uncharacterized protein n=1 Tax=Candidatus Kentrum sp. TUN TaxID=2126343 RepID=A0A450ZMT6_9GAMM|nr:MAG: hypothetical protein BECKTUN1418E_GA0071001_10035 [Candidatus Kentron sp. TUN]VFK51648.1 MAG: hypothetical protein BECKTUN1418F_GA0071002_10035 [Candidatus Kentron sp. TUN]VFK55091.1 MAG: hypothetical protein BECKTUN1418D_GA0071000_10279 [Candidatus Kentron sp. TUN]